MASQRALKRESAVTEDAIKREVHEFMRAQEVYGRVKEIVGSPAGSDADREAQIMRELSSHGIVDEVVRALRSRRAGAAVGLGLPPAAAAAGSSGAPQLLLRVVGGRAFTDVLDADVAGSRFLQLHVSFAGQRFSTPAVPDETDPALTGLFALDLSALRATPAALVRQCAPIQFVVTRIGADGTAEVVGTQLLEWRKALVTGFFSGTLELTRYGGGTKVPSGLLYTRLELTPTPRGAAAADEERVRDQLTAEHVAESAAEREFDAHARAFCREYSDMRPDHADRPISVFARSELGLNAFVGSFVAPVREFRGGGGDVVSSLLSTPRHAARFVALVPLEDNHVVGGVRQDVCSTAHAMLARGAGNQDDHAHLLCSLLLGFGLNAYVCRGSRRPDGAAYSWVAALDLTTAPNCDATFWDPLSGERCAHTLYTKHLATASPEGAGAPFPGASVFAVYNDKNFFANIQADAALTATSFNVLSSSLWKQLGQRHVERLPAPPKFSVCARPFPLRSSLGATELQIEAEIKSRIAEHRSMLQLSCRWDDELGHTLSPALAAYEHERLVGASYGNDDFQQAVKLAVPPGSTFHGCVLLLSACGAICCCPAAADPVLLAARFPICFTHVNTGRMFATILRHATGKAVLEERSSNTRLAFRCQICMYAEGITAVWCIFASVGQG